MPLPKSLTTVTPLSKILALVLFILFPVFGFYLGTQYRQVTDSSMSITPSGVCSAQRNTCSETEKNQIDVWIQKNNLNEYGDSQDTVYLGGTPLFNEATGKELDRYQYILQQHPDRPWDN